MTEKPSARDRVRAPKRVRRARLIAASLMLIILASGIWFMNRYIEQAKPHSLDSFAMGSYVRQTVWGKEPEKAAAETVHRIEELEREISWRQDGDVAHINSQAGGEPVTLDEETGTGDLLAEMLELCKRCGGALDVTIGPVTRLWDFDNEPRLPDEKELEKAVELVDYSRVSIDSEEYMYAVPNEDGSHTDSLGVRYYVSLAKPGMAIDLGAVGKGAACDNTVSRYICAGDVSGAVVAVGGSVGLYGRKPGGEDWQVGVRDPEGAGSLGVLSLPGGFVSTSGSYEKYFEQDGKTYCHLLDPRTGYPAESGLVSVTVWCPPEMKAEYQYPGALSDGLATACFVLGIEDSMELLDSYGAEAVFIDKDGAITVTDGLKERFTLSGVGYTLLEAG